MGIELNLYKDLGNVALTITELTSVARLIRSHVRNPEFLAPFERLLGELGTMYDVLLDALAPLTAITSEEAFAAQFDASHAHYQAGYLFAASQPRPAAERGYEAYLVLKTLKESRTGYPLLKRCFARLDDLIDKWVTNDAWLVMSMDGALKKASRLLDEVAQVKQRDVEDAWLLFAPAFADIDGYLESIRQRRPELGHCTGAGGEPAPRWMNALLG